MIRILLVVAIATHVSCQHDQNIIVVTKEQFCKENRIHIRNCEKRFATYLDANPHIEQCMGQTFENRYVYSDNCPALLHGQSNEPTAPCIGNDCNYISTRIAKPSVPPSVPNRPSASTFERQPTSNRYSDSTWERQPAPHRHSDSTWERQPAAANEEFEVPTSSVPYDKKVMGFAVKLFQQAFPSDDTSNYIISPVMVQSLLSYLNAGGSNATRMEMERVLQLNMLDLHDIDRALKPHTEDGPISKNKLDSASQIFKSTTIELLPSFQKSLKKNHVPLEEMDFSNRKLAAESINNWAKEKTRQRIVEVIDEKSIDPSTKLLLMNALYFNGTWMYQFNKTERGTFHLSGQPPKRSAVSMMYLTKDLRNGNTRTDDSSTGLYWIELPYDGDRMSMILFLPNERFQLDRELRRFTAEQLQTILSEIEQDEPSKVRVQLPEFKAESTVSLVEPLKMLGLVSMFGDSKPFDQLSKDEVKISDVKQKSFLTVNPYGTVATSVTTATVIPLSITHTLDFKADQPFALIIMDKQKKLPLFFAKISQPLKVQDAKQ
uniref:Serpin domain-containing protein n=1 Tax=Anopheles culicifacies TaxID=139723 RepID=A0A182M177_9DIPT